MVAACLGRSTLFLWAIVDRMHVSIRHAEAADVAPVTVVVKATFGIVVPVPADSSGGIVVLMGRVVLLTGREWWVGSRVAVSWGCTGGWLFCVIGERIVEWVLEDVVSKEEIVGVCPVGGVVRFLMCAKVGNKVLPDAFEGVACVSVPNDQSSAKLNKGSV